MTLKGHYALCFKTSVFRSPPWKFEWRYIHYQRRRCSPMTLDSRGFPGAGALNDSGVIENLDFQGFRTLCLRHLRKWGQHYYIVLFSPLSPFHWPQNAWLWLTLNGLNGNFTLNFHYYELTLRVIIYLFTVEYVYVNGTSGDVGSGVADRDLQNIWNPRKNGGSFVDATSSEP